MLTGQMIHDSWTEIEEGPHGAWEDLSTHYQVVYDAVAEHLNAQLAQAGEDARTAQYTPEQVALLLRDVSVKNMQRWLDLQQQSDPLEKHLIQQLAMADVADALHIVASVVPDDIRPLVRQILSLYKQVKED